MGKSVEGKPCINIESKILELTIYLYRCYDEYEAPSSCNTTVYLSGSMPSLTRNHPEGFCVALSLMCRLWCVRPLDWNLECVSSSYCWGGIYICCGKNHTRISSNMIGSCLVSCYLTEYKDSLWNKSYA